MDKRINIHRVTESFLKELARGPHKADMGLLDAYQRVLTELTKTLVKEWKEHR